MPVQLPSLADPSAVFRGMGMLTDEGPIGFIGTVRIYAGAHPDSMLVAVLLSMRNRGLAFRRDGNTFLGEYRVEITLRQEAGVIQQAAREERIRVGTFRETQRSDESVIFQQVLPVPAGQYTLAVSVRDRNGPNLGRAEQQLTVPQRQLPAVSMPLAVYEAQPREQLDQPLRIVPNPRNAVEYGGDTLHFYVEGYGLTPDARLTVSAFDANGRLAWSDTTRIPGASPVQSMNIAVPPSRLSLGRYDLRLMLGPDVLASAPFLVSFSDQWVVGNLEDMISLLRYFPQADSLRALVNATPEQRATAWQRFWRASDPNSATPENEALDDYFRRVQLANERYRDEGVAGWLTERGEVMITIGEPDDTFDRRPDLQGRGRVLMWTYNQYRLTLYFVDDNGFGRFRLEPRSRSEYLRILSRIQRM